MYANKIAAIADEEERAAYVAARTAEQQADINLLRMGSDLVVDAVVEPGDLRAELERADGRRRPLEPRHRTPPPPDQPRLAEEDDDVRRPARATDRGAAAPPSRAVDGPRPRRAAGAGARVGLGGRVLGVGRPPAALVAAVDEGAQRRAGGFPLLRRRHDQRRRQLPRPLGRGPGHGRPAGVDLGGRARRRPHAHLRRAGRRVEPARRGSARPGRAQGRRRRGLHAQPGGGVHRDPRLQPHRRDLHGAVLRVRGGRPCRPGCGARASGRRRGGRELPARQAHPAAGDLRAARGRQHRRAHGRVVDRTGRRPSRCKTASSPTPTC